MAQTRIPKAQLDTTLLDTSSAQTISGVKTFSTAPVISTITNTGTLTLPTATDTLVGRATTDTLSSKTLTNPLITGNSSPLSTPSTGFGAFGGIGTGAVRPGWKNSSGNDERIMASLTTTNTQVQTGWGILSIAGGSQTTVGSAVTFPIAYSSAPFMQISCLGSSSSSPATFTGLGASGEWFTISALSATTFVPTVLARAVEVSTTFIVYSWLAIGLV